MNFLDIDYLKNGNECQKQAYKTLHQHRIMEKLKAFEPILTGTIPIDIAIESSDLDIICFCRDKNQFTETLAKGFGSASDFQIRQIKIGGHDSVICNFKANNFEIEVFGQNIPTQQQNAYRHMLIEHQILLENGEDFRLKIIDLKRQGYKTEPAFAELLRLKGDPYLSLLKYTTS